MNGLRVIRMNSLNRGCVERVVILFTDENCQPITKAGKVLYLTAKKKQWDLDKEDASALFKVRGVIDPSEPNRVVFNLTEKDTYLDANKTYFCDIVETDSDGSSNARRVFLGSFEIIGGANNKQAGDNL